MVDPGVARERVARRLAAAERAPAAHGDAALLRALAAGTSWTSAFQSVSIAAPVLHVDTTAGYDPCLAAILAFVNRR